MEGVKSLLWGSFLAAVLCLTAVACAQQLPPLSAPADLPADPYLWDFGKAKEGVKLEHVFEIVNDTDMPMKIREVTSSCGCTASEVSRKDLAPGESAQVKVTFDTTKYQGFTEQFVYVNTDSKTKPVIRLTIKAEVTP